MASDDLENQKELERKRILEEIRRRAEEAELKRIEEEEQQSADAEPQELPPPAPIPKSSAPATPPKAAPPPPPEPPPPPPPAPPPAPPSPSPPRRQEPPRRREKPPSRPPSPGAGSHAEELRERLVIALDRGKTDRASSLLEEFASLAPDDPELQVYQARVAALEQLAQRKREAEHRARDEAARVRAEREEHEQRITELLESADSLYQQEKYSKSLQALDEALALDPTHKRASKMRESVREAYELAEQIRKEEERRKAAEAATAPPAPKKQEPPPAGPGDVWGAAVSTPSTEADGFLIPGGDAQAGAVPPKPPLTARVANKVKRSATGIRIPVRTLLTVGVILACAAIAYYVVDTIRSAVFPPKYSILVLPPAAADSMEAYYVDGFAGDFIRDLSVIGDLRVMDQPTTMALRDLRSTGRDVARMVGAGYVLQYQLLRRPESVSLTVTLSDTASPRPVFSRSYDVPSTEFASLRREIVRTIVDTMQIDLTEDEQNVLRITPWVTARGYDLYLKGRALLVRRNPDDILRAIQAFEECLIYDSTFTYARSALGWAHILAFEGGLDTTGDRIARAARAAQLAIAQGAFHAETYRVWGMVAWHRGDIPLATTRLEQAVAVSPSDAEAWRRLAVALAVRGSMDEAVKAAEQAVSTDPRNVDMHTTLGEVNQFRGDFQAAAQSYSNGLRLSADKGAYVSQYVAEVELYLQRPDRAIQLMTDRVAQARSDYVEYYKLGRILQSAGRPPQEWATQLTRARELIEEHLRQAPDDGFALSILALVQKRLGKFREAEAACARALELWPDDPEVRYNAARLYAVHGDKKTSLSHLAKALNRRYLLERVNDMDFFRLRKDPEFVATVTR